jgi:hypothetical protein
MVFLIFIGDGNEKNGKILTQITAFASSCFTLFKKICGLQRESSTKFSGGP